MYIRVDKLLRGFYIFCFVLFAMDFLGMGWYIFGVASMVLVFYLATLRKDIVIDSQFAWIIVLALANYLIMLFNSNADIITKTMKYLMSPIFGYLIGFVIASQKSEKDNILKLYMLAVIPYFIHGFLNIINYEGIIDYQREVPDFWTGEMWKATLACTYFALVVPLCFLAFVSKEFYKKIAYLFFTVFSVYACIITASRSVIYIGILVLGFEFFLYVSERKHSQGENARKQMTILGFLMVAAIATGYVITNFSFLSDTEFFRRVTKLDFSDEPRIELFSNIIFNAWKYPLGNMPYFYSHNTWLDFLRESGWITFVCFVAITCIALKNVVTIYKDKTIKQEHRIAVVAMMTAFLMDMFVEPIMDGAAIMFCLFFYFLGINNYYAKDAIKRIDNG